ncbi:ENDD1 protein, partial [Syrrhaptes paradoxus]|nr:ENDD1 protein [Syrrhaptes paradoxus]
MLLLLLLQVLASCLWSGRSEVVPSFGNSCPQFFFRQTPPNQALEPQNPAWICQRYQNQYHFATLYDKNLRVPVYSAYRYQPGPGTRPKTWFVEPQLISSKFSKDMKTEGDIIKKYHIKLQQIAQSQAIFNDYRNLKGLSRGHLNPSCHHPNASRPATFTLTNIVPQDEKLNMGTWQTYEVETMANKSQGCTTTYIVVGAVPGNNYIPSGRVNIPSHIWSSACCELGPNQRKTWAVIAENDKDRVQLLTLGDLEDVLTQLYGRGQVSLFHSGCPRQ